jgi:hypothetical protein
MADKLLKDWVLLRLSDPIGRFFGLSDLVGKFLLVLTSVMLSLLALWGLHSARFSALLYILIALLQQVLCLWFLSMDIEYNWCYVYCSAFFFISLSVFVLLRALHRGVFLTTPLRAIIAAAMLLIIDYWLRVLIRYHETNRSYTEADRLFKGLFEDVIGDNTIVFVVLYAIATNHVMQ